MKNMSKLAVISLILMMLAKGLVFLWHAPLYAYANNYDQVRTMSRYGIIPDDPRFPLGVASFAAPLINFHLEQRTEFSVYRSSDQPFVQATISLSRWFRGASDAGGKQPIDVRWKGTLSFLLLVLGIGFCAWRLLRDPNTHCAAIVLAGIGLLLTDPFNMMYASTWYMEFSALVYAAIGISALYVAIVQSPTKAISPYVAWMLIILFGVAKYQYQFFPIGLFVFFVLVWRRRFGKRFLLIALISAVLVPVYLAGTKLQPNNIQIAGANNANSLFNVFLTLPAEKEEAIRLAGLPPKCERFIGTTWFRPTNNSDAIMLECPEIVSVGQWRKVMLAAAGPSTFFSATVHAAGLSQDWIDPMIGHVEGKVWAKLNEELSFPAFSVAQWVAMVPSTLYASLYLLILASATLLGGLAARNPQRSVLWSTAYALVGVVGSYAFVCAFFGEGFNDIQKHAHLSFSAIAILSGITIVHALSFAYQRIVGRRPSRLVRAMKS